MALVERLLSLHGVPLELIRLGALVLAVLIAAIVDARARRIPNWLTVSAGVVLLGLHALETGWGTPTTGAFGALLGALAMGGWFTLFAWRGTMGWGDVKLAAVVGAGLGLRSVPLALLLVTVTGALQALASLIWRGALSGTVRGVLSAPNDDRHPPRPRSNPIPYGVAIAVGTIWTIWSSRPAL